MKKIITVFLFLSMMNYSYCQDDFIQIETNKILCLINFLETASNQPGTSSAFSEYINDNLGTDEKFNHQVERYALLKIDYSSERPEYPTNRYSSLDTKDLIWIAASNAENIKDFSERILGYLPHGTHHSLIKILQEVAPYYDHLVWKKEQKNITRIHKQLSTYKKDISNLYLKISSFYNTQWDTNVPFKIMLYPIPLEGGMTTAIPKGNALICGFLSHNEEDYKGRLGVIIHEMCHVLFEEQSPEFQHQIDKWFAASESPYAKLTYNYIDEGLATALGNGWAYEQLNGSIDTEEWYNDKYIEGFAHAIFPLVKQYMDEGKSMDKEFVDKSIELFAKTFPKALTETKLLMNEIQIFANSEEDKDINIVIENVHKNFNIRSRWFSSPVDSEENQESFKKEKTTKLFIIESNNDKTIEFLNKTFAELNIKTPLNSIDILKDNRSQSPLIIINIDDLSKLSKGLKLLSELEYLDYNKNYKIK